MIENLFDFQSVIDRNLNRMRSSYGIQFERCLNRFGLYKSTAISNQTGKRIILAP